ncbi:sn-glycerol-3-phosphate ABC transporter ATP-binding protein UgpC [Litoreibacter janthinus]|uniref:Carbohydrate ABC transporter ATP-binding protein, CUT1 family n=1 Tax=Litoreibacter janthinus TaxID=670154 RepID=A0A1I6GVB7_9RHOB|nr:sn-glycerol-3-phosphate ABC transporter ATP-binding protein UgpC [Litoreibacter janthinus]SFR46090.1 carbohydrate ABC transporter ATP-binding protein, CUT1 family [Litoreibacter janthinus]
MATIKLDNIKKSFGKTDVIHGVDIDIKDGEFIVIVGPSGCGKSTLLRMVAGLETVTSGEIQIDGARVNDDEPMDRDIAMVFQNYALYPHMSVEENMAYGLKIAKTPKDEITARVAEAARMLQLEPYLKRKPRELSGGQRQRVAMGRAIVRKPKVFLFDEPLSNLDAKLRVQMRLEIKELQSRLGITALYVTHDQVEAMTLADRMIVMNGGVADQIGAPLDVYSNPKTEFVAGFIGSPATNFVAASLVPKAPHGAARVGIRPEHAEICAEGFGKIDAVVLFTEALGAETLVHLRLKDVADTFTVRQDGADPLPAAGAAVGVRWAEDLIMWFDQAGKRV